MSNYDDDKLNAPNDNGYVVQENNTTAQADKCYSYYQMVDHICEYTTAGQCRICYFHRW